MLVIGSVALNRHFDKVRTPADIDYIATFNEVQNFIKTNKKSISIARPLSVNKWHVRRHQDGREINYEFDIAWDNTSSKMILDRYRHEEGDYMYAEPDVLLALKMSHRFLRNSPHFLKTMQDIRFLQEQGVTTDGLEDIIKLREKETYTYDHPSLNQSKKDFFSGDGVEYVYDHDTIHESVAIKDKPAYMNYISGEVMFSREKFLQCDYDTKLRGVVEEALVLAVERSLIPYPGKKTPTQAFLFALEKVCTSITSGIFREFAWENYHEAVDLYHDACYDYFDKVQQDIKSGLIKQYENHHELV